MFNNLVDHLFTERMDQNEAIFIRYMNDPAFREAVGGWMGTEAYRRLRRAVETEPSRPRDHMLDAPRLPSTAPPKKPCGFKVVEGRRQDRYITCLPLVPLAAAAGAFGDPQNVEPELAWEWVELAAKRPLTQGMFVARIIGRSMEPAIPDGAYALFRAPVAGTRQGKTVLVELRDAVDPETGRYTVKRYESRKAATGGEVGEWHHAKVTLKPNNPEFEPIVLADVDEDAVRVVAELVEVIE